MEPLVIMSQHSDTRGRALALDRGPDGTYEAYNEAAFRHFLGVEERRAERAGRAVLLLLVHVEVNGVVLSITPAVAAQIFSALTGCVREIDFVGWYRMNVTAGAVLAQDGCVVTNKAVTGLRERVTGHLHERLSGALRRQVKVRVVHASTEAGG